MNAEAAALISKLGLAPLPNEGGFFARTWTSRETLPSGRPFGTAIYFLLTPTDFSALHRVDADELWHFHAGDSVEHVQLIAGEAAAQVVRLGVDFSRGEIPQRLAPNGVWQGARLALGGVRGWALLSCTMSPGWDDIGFALASRETLSASHPQAAAWIAALTRAG